MKLETSSNSCYEATTNNWSDVYEPNIERGRLSSAVGDPNSVVGRGCSDETKQTDRRATKTAFVTQVSVTGKRRVYVCL